MTGPNKVPCKSIRALHLCIVFIITVKAKRIAFNPTELRKTKIAYNFGFSDCNGVNTCIAFIPILPLNKVTRQESELSEHPSYNETLTDQFGALMMLVTTIKFFNE